MCLSIVLVCLRRLSSSEHTKTFHQVFIVDSRRTSRTFYMNNFGTPWESMETQLAFVSVQFNFISRRILELNRFVSFCHTCSVIWLELIRCVRILRRRRRRLFHIHRVVLRARACAVLRRMVIWCDRIHRVNPFSVPADKLELKLWCDCSSRQCVSDGKDTSVTDIQKHNPVNRSILFCLSLVC